MMQFGLIGIGAGAASALLFASLTSGSLLSIILFYLAGSDSCKQEMNKCVVLCKTGFSKYTNQTNQKGYAKFYFH